MKQNDVNAAGVDSTTVDIRITAIGVWGEDNVRYFDGLIDNVRFSSSARYTTDFTPPCPGDFVTDASTIGLWDFDEGTGTVAGDGSSNAFDGTINGAIWVIDTICAITGLQEAAERYHVSLYPNPVSNILVIENTCPDDKCAFSLYNSLGQIIYDKLVITRHQMLLSTSEMKSGIYYYQLFADGQEVESGKLLKE